jgi:hypothetical protein
MALWLPIEITDASAGAETAIPSTVPTMGPTLGAAVGRVYVETLPLGYWIMRPPAPKLATLFEPARVMSAPPEVATWRLIAKSESPGAAEMTCPLV